MAALLLRSIFVCFVIFCIFVYLCVSNWLVCTVGFRSMRLSWWGVEGGEREIERLMEFIIKKSF